MNDNQQLSICIIFIINCETIKVKKTKNLSWQSSNRKIRILWPKEWYLDDPAENYLMATTLNCLSSFGTYFGKCSTSTHLPSTSSSILEHIYQGTVLFSLISQLLFKIFNSFHTLILISWNGLSSKSHPSFTNRLIYGTNWWSLS